VNLNHGNKNKTFEQKQNKNKNRNNKNKQKHPLKNYKMMRGIVAVLLACANAEVLSEETPGLRALQSVPSEPDCVTLEFSRIQGDSHNGFVESGYSVKPSNSRSHFHAHGNLHGIHGSGHMVITKVDGEAFRVASVRDYGGLVFKGDDGTTWDPTNGMISSPPSTALQNIKVLNLHGHGTIDTLTLCKALIEVKCKIVSEINPKSKGVTPVRCFGSEKFDVKNVNWSTVGFGPEEAPLAKKHCSTDADIDGDGFNDMMCHFHTQKTGIESDDNGQLACVTGKVGTMNFEGCDKVSIKP